jgi:cell division protease FtsH
MRSLAIWVAILASLALFVSIFDGRSAGGDGQTIAYSDFVTRVEQGTVKSVR